MEYRYLGKSGLKVLVLNAKVTEVNSSHVIMLSHPDKVTAVIEEAAGR